MHMWQEIDYTIIGARVRDMRRERGMTQAELARATGVTGSFIGHIERGEKVASLETMAKLSRALGTSLDNLVFGIQIRCERESCPLFDDVAAMLRAYGLEGDRG